MKLEKDNKKSPFAEKMADFELPLEAQAWSDFEAFRATETAHQSRKKRWVFGSLLLLLLGGMVGYWQSDRAFKGIDNQLIVPIFSVESPQYTPSVFSHFENKMASKQALIFAKYAAAESLSFLGKNKSINPPSTLTTKTNSLNSFPILTTKASAETPTDLSQNEEAVKPFLPVEKVVSSKPDVATEAIDLLNPSISTDKSSASESKKADSVSHNGIGLVANDRFSRSEMAEIPPLSNFLILEDVASLQGVVPPSFQLSKAPLVRGAKNVVRVGIGQAFLGFDAPKQNAVTVQYFRRITPLMALGGNFSFCRYNIDNQVVSAEAQINFSLVQRPRFAFLLTAGYGFRVWRLSEPNSDGNGKGVTIGLEPHYRLNRNHTIGLRFEVKEAPSGNLGYYLLVSRAF